MNEQWNNNIISIKAQFLVTRKILLKICEIGGVIIKGAPLSILAYNSPYKRNYSDIDILVDRSSVSEIEYILSENGYRMLNQQNERKNRIICMSQSHQLIPYYNCIEGMDIYFDINHDIFWGEYDGKHIDILEFISDKIPIEVYGTKVNTLSPIKALIQLMLHGYKDMNSIFLLSTRKSIKYDMFKDIYYLLINNIDSIPLDQLYFMCNHYEIIPYIFYMLYYTDQIFNDKLLMKYIESFRTIEGENLLNCYGLCDKERREWRCDFKTRFESKNLYTLIKDDLTSMDQRKIEFNKHIFWRDENVHCF